MAFTKANLMRMIRGGGEVVVGDSTAPTLSSPTDAANGSTGASLAVTTDEGNGTLYWFISTSSTPPSAASLKAGTGAVAFGAQAVAGTGVQNASPTGLTASTAYFAHFLHRDAAGNDSAIATANGFTTAAASTTESFGALTAAGAGGVPVTGTSISSGDASGHWQIVSGYLSPSSTGDTANLNAGPYSLTFNDASTLTLTINANARDVRTQAEWDTAIALSAATLSGSTIYVRPDSYRAGATLTSGVDGTAARLRRADYGGLTIQGRVPAIVPGSGNNLPTAASDRATFNRFVMRGARNVTLRYLATTAAAESKVSLIGETANHCYGITIDQCHVSGVVFDPNGDYSNSANFPMFGIDAITVVGSASNAIGTLVITNNIVEYAGTCISARVDRGSSETLTVSGNLVRYFYDDGIGLAKATPTATVWYDCVATVEDNVVIENVGDSTDSGNPHNDAIRFIGHYTNGADWTIYVNRNRVYVGNTRGDGHMQGILASDMKSTSGDSGFFYKGTAIGNAICTDNGVAFNIENAKNFVVLNNTVVTSNIASASFTITMQVGAGSTMSTTSGTHRIERNVAEAYSLGGTPTLVSNTTLGKGGITIPYATAFVGGGADWYPDTLAEMMTWFARKTAGPLDLGGGPPDGGAIASAAVTWATTIPGSNGVNLVS